MTLSSSPPAAQDVDLITALAHDLADADFTHHGVAQVLGPEAVSALDREQVVPGQLRILESPEQACAVLTALWLVSLEVTAEQVDAALPRTGAAGLQQLGLITRRSDSEVAPLVDLRPYQVETRAGTRDMWVTSDLSAHQVAGPLPHDHVLGVGQASLTLASITHRRPVRTGLDIGTGCGIQLLHLLDHCEHVTGTDLSARALEFARFNLVLNASALGLDPEHLQDRVELVQGSLLEPVAGRRFDLVVSNPPFVITPRSPQETETDRYTYRDGGRQGDELMGELITELPGVLAAGGTAQMLGNWEVPRGAAHWWQRPKAWVEQADLEAWFIQRDVQTPAEYAETWLRDASEERSIDQYRRRYADYLRDFAQREVDQIGFGLIWLRRRDHQQRWQHFEEITGEVQQPLGPVIGDVVDRAAAVLQQPDQVLNTALVTAVDVTEERYQRFGAAHPEVIFARQGAGLRRSRPISSAAAGFLAAADGEYTASQLITAVCSLTDAAEDQLRAEVLELYQDGFIEPASAGQTPSSSHI
ncbi:methyltransferase [Nesterenkonia sp.]|uniref:DUF7059 domain-containing protein n=1 Tax=Nesterenkonia sp. TaxID=704201 RepID=UPI002605EB01|nr:methyltransferase [Nesterenkonia sp.]